MNPLSRDVARIHFAYSAWASARMVEAASRLTEEELNRDHKSADKSVLGTLVHVFAADRVWYARVTGAPITKFIDESDYQLTVLQTEWPGLHQWWTEYLDTADLSAIISYKDMKGNSHQSPLWQILLHVINHGTHHRGMVAAMMRAMGHAPPALDEIAYFRQLAQ
ncbi:MAG: DinB family protein [Acidobacteria bacterium]|nr:DinB family protein [Acidobacteriota bacterium]